MKIIKINFSEIENKIQNGDRVTVKHLSQEMGVSPMVVRREFTNHYGDRVQFLRGRNGGLKIQQSS